jgi:staphylococcal nuclease domain-containing protein 1
LDCDPREFLNTWKGKKIDAIIEQVRDGSTFRVSLKIEEGLFQNITLTLSGVKSPGYRKDVPGVDDLIEPFGSEARYFSETRLLQRDVKILLEGTNNNSFVGSVLHPNGDIAEALLGEGLAKVVDWTVAIVTAGPSKLRAAEIRAKKSNLRLWKGFVPTSNLMGGKRMEFDGVVNRYYRIF